MSDAARLIREPNLVDPDGAYRQIVEAHRGLTDQQSADFDAALVLILCNHIGEPNVLREALALARLSIGMTVEAGRSAPLCLAGDIMLPAPHDLLV